MKIFFFLPSLAPGGAERVFIQLANHYRENGLDVSLVCGEASGPLQSLIDPALEVIDLGAPRVLRAILPLRNLLKQHPDAVLFCCMTHANVAMLIAARVFGQHRGRIVIQEVALISRGRNGQGWFRTLVLNRLMKRVYLRADTILAVSESVARETEQMVGAACPPVQTIPNPIDLLFIRAKAEEDVDHPWIGGGVPIILGVGRLSPEKDFGTLIQAIQIIRAEQPVKLVILGDGPERVKLEGEAWQLGLDECVCFAGQHDNPWAYMTRADLTVVSSISEGFSLVLVEAMALGCPVVSTACGSGPISILKKGELGPLVPVGDAQRLAEAMLTRLKQPRASTVLSAAADRFAIGVLAKEYAKVLFP
jgi:glycosyltransferase involved in cell wall biosynthesis